MPSTRLSRRRLLRASPIALVGLAGCLSQPRSSDPSTNSSPRSPTTDTTNTGTSDDDEETSVASIDVADFVLYPLAGVYPHVHHQSHTQYVIVQLTTSKSRDTLRSRLSLTLDEEAVPLAERQPVPWEHDTVDFAFAVPKTETFDRGRVVFEQLELRSLSKSTIDRLNSPPVFEITDESASPSEIQAGERGAATVRFALANTGGGRGTFGASLKGNFVSGSNTVTATLHSGSHREITASTEIVGKDEKATIRLDWGSGKWSTGIPVVGPWKPLNLRPRHRLRKREEMNRAVTAT